MASMERSILVVEDDPAIRLVLRTNLEDEGYRVVEAETGEQALVRMVDDRSDVVLVDLRLPGIQGLDLIRSLRGTSQVPIIIVTAQTDSHDVVAGLEAGADDYVTKPFSPRELVARVRALLRRVERRPAPPGDALTLGELEIDPAARQVRIAGEIVHLTPTEFDLLALLSARPGVVFSREQLLAEVWGWRDGSGQRTVDSHVRGLRRKLGSDLVRTVHGVGYALEASR